MEINKSLNKCTLINKFFHSTLVLEVPCVIKPIIIKFV